MTDKVNNMTLEKIYNTDLINDKTNIYVKKEGIKLAYGNWYHDNILNYAQKELRRFSWYDDNVLFVELK